MPESPAKPGLDEVEFSAFGPGYGECLLVHLGQGEWMIVDSCVRSGRSPALDYLRKMGVDPATAVKLVVATHWHDDHVRGISDVLASCTSSTFSCSVALSPDELVLAIGALPAFRGGKLTSGVEEMRRVFELLASGSDADARWAIENRPLYSRAGSPGCRVVALAPCDSVLIDAYRSVAQLVAEGATRRVVKPDRNLGAVVLWVEVGDATMLLGSDLQEIPGGGWTTVLVALGDMKRQGEIFKVPHHGSENGHLDEVWEQVLVRNPEAVVCPHQNGRNYLPTPRDLERLCELANVHLTAPGGPREVIRKGRPMRPPAGECGQVTLRRRVGAGTAWSVDYAGTSARPGCDPTVGRSNS